MAIFLISRSRCTQVASRVENLLDSSRSFVSFAFFLPPSPSFFHYFFSSSRWASAGQLKIDVQARGPLMRWSPLLRPRTRLGTKEWRRESEGKRGRAPECACARAARGPTSRYASSGSARERGALRGLFLEGVRPSPEDY